MPRHIIHPSSVEELQLSGLRHDSYCSGDSANGRKRLNVHIAFPPGQPPVVSFSITNRVQTHATSTSSHTITTRQLPDFTTLEEAIREYNEV
jgi:hypothetical protein